MNLILNSIQPVVQASQFVRFNPSAAERFVDLHKDRLDLQPNWEGAYHFNDGSPRTLMYLLVLDALNFCFWDDEPRWRIEHEGQRLDGYAALAARLRQAFEQRQPLDDAHELARIAFEDVDKLLAGEGRIPLLQQRWEILRETGAVLLREFDGRVENLIESTNGSALNLTSLLVARFPSFRDEALFNRQRVYFYKRAQIFCADVYGAFGGKGYGGFPDIDQLTAFADYKLPQLLRAHHILSYEPSLACRVDAKQPLASGSSEEIEIRALTIDAVEQLKRMFAQAGKPLKSIEIDWLLWHWSQDIEAKPYHRTRTIYY